MQAIDTQDNQFHDGNGTTELGTILPAWWLNQIQAELLSVLSAGRVAPNKAQTNQLLAAINKLIAGAVVNNLTSNNADKALSALQGKVLAEQVAAVVSGSFNLKGLLTTQNLNDLAGTENYGVWQCALNASATSERNYPINLAGVLLVLPSAYRGKQIYFSFHDQGIWMRDTRSNATDVTWGAWLKLGDDKLGNSGNQTLSGSLTVTQPLKTNNPTVWHRLEMASGDGTWVLETSPQGSTDKRFQFKFVKNGETTLYCRFPALTKNETVAYESWVNENKVAKSGDTMTGNLVIRAGGWSGVHLFNNGNLEVRAETVPVNEQNEKFFQFGVRQGGGSFTVYQFPKATEHQTIAYQSFVNQKANERVAKTGDTMTGHLVIRAGGWSGVHLFNDKNRETRIETVPEVERNVLLKFADRTGTGSFTGYFFPKATEDQVIAYQSWVNANFGGKSTVAVLTGKIAHGGTIPLPHGFEQHQCKWFVSMHNNNPSNRIWDLREAGGWNHDTTQVWADGNRVVTCRVYRDYQTGSEWFNGEANYMIIGVK